MNQYASKKVSGREKSVADFGESEAGVTRVVSRTLTVLGDPMAEALMAEKRKGGRENELTVKFCAEWRLLKINHDMIYLFMTLF